MQLTPEQEQRIGVHIKSMKNGDLFREVAKMISEECDDGATLEFIPRPLEDWHEDIGPVLWVKFPIDEPPYVGSPLDCGYGYKVCIAGSDGTDECMTGTIGGWPGYHTHWIPLPKIISPE